MRCKIDIAVACLYPIRPDRIGGMDRFFWAFDQAVKKEGKSIVWFFPFAHDFSHYLRQGLQINFITDNCFELGVINSLKSDYSASLCICHFVSYNTRYVAHLKSNVMKLVFVDHMSRPRIPKTMKYRIWYFIKGIINRKYVDGIIAVSDFVRHQVVKELGGSWAVKTQTIYNGVDLSLYRSSTSISNPITDLFAIGYTTIDKGFQDLIHAVIKLKEEYPYLSCVIAGDGPFKPQLESMVKDLDLSSHIRFIGNVNNQFDWMRGARAVVIPSLWYEACPFTVIESMACGSSMVVSDAGGIPEMVGDTAMVYPKGNVDLLCKSIRSILSLDVDIETLKDLRSKRVSDKFDLNSMVIKHLDYAVRQL